MSDILLSLANRNGREYYDIGFSANGDFDITEGLETSILLSLFSDGRVSATEVTLPENRGGWIGALNSNYVPGSKLWLLMQRPLEDVSGDLAVNYAREALQWLIDDKVLKDINISYTLTPKALKLIIQASTYDNVYNTYSYDLVRNTIDGH